MSAILVVLQICFVRKGLVGDLFQGLMVVNKTKNSIASSKIIIREDLRRTKTQGYKLVKGRLDLKLIGQD